MVEPDLPIASPDLPTTSPDLVVPSPELGDLALNLDEVTDELVNLSPDAEVALTTQSSPQSSPQQFDHGPMHSGFPDPLDKPVAIFGDRPEEEPDFAKDVIIGDKNAVFHYSKGGGNVGQFFDEEQIKAKGRGQQMFLYTCRYSTYEIKAISTARLKTNDELFILLEWSSKGKRLYEDKNKLNVCVSTLFASQKCFFWK